jgi:DNA-directed RNA polymerase specialized sigma24 family protein
MAAPLKVDYAFDTEDLESSAKIVKFAILTKHQEQDAAQEHELASFEETMLPHMDAAHNLAKWLLRNEEDAQDVVQEAYLRAFKSFGGFHGSNGRAWLLTIVRNTAYTLLKEPGLISPQLLMKKSCATTSRESRAILEHAERGAN